MIKILLKKPNLKLFAKNCKNEYAFDLLTNDQQIFLFENALLRKNIPEEIQIFKSSIDKLFSISQHKQNSNISNDLYTSKTTNYSDEANNINNSLYKIKNKNSINEKIGPESFIVHGLIGKGSFGEVYLVEKKNNDEQEGTLHAMKVLDKKKILDQNIMKYALTERNILGICQNPFIVGLDYAFQTQEKLILVLQFCPGGDLAEQLDKYKRFTEDRIRIYLAEIIIALEDLHSKDIIYRDLKPENINNEGHAILTDFGLSKGGVLDHLDGAQSFCGSIAYLAPEMIKRSGHGKAVDWYLLGVLMHEMLLGIPPFYSNNREELFFKITNQKLVLPNSLSEPAKSLLFALLEKNPANRLGSGVTDAEEIKVHQFFENINWNDAYKRKLKPIRPERKIKIFTQIKKDEIFGNQSQNHQNNYIPGWSFYGNQIL